MTYPRKRRPDTIYFARVGEYVKIGSSCRVPERLKRICIDHTHKPDDLADETPVLLATIPGTVLVEGTVHTLLAAHRHVGEWFHANDEVLDFAANAAQRLADHHAEVAAFFPECVS